MSSLSTELGAEIRDANGEIVRRIPFRRCHSLLKQFIQLLAAQMSQAACTIKLTNGTTQSGDEDPSNFQANSVTNTTFGVVIGSGDSNAVTMEDYKLEAQLVTNIAYQPVTFAQENPNASTWRLAISRGFTNNTGATVNVKEVGLYVVFEASYITCIDRTLYSVSVAAGETLTLTYRLAITL